MSTKWKWVLLVWHRWRAAVWRAEMCLFPKERHGNIVSTPLRYMHAEAMYGYHHYSAEDLHRSLFPPEPVDWDEALNNMKRGLR